MEQVAGVTDHGIAGVRNGGVKQLGLGAGAPAVLGAQQDEHGHFRGPQLGDQGLILEVMDAQAQGPAGGGIGNVIDRIRLGYVIDFFEFRVWSYIFNFADICVVVGCFLVLFYVLFESRFEGRRKA